MNNLADFTSLLKEKKHLIKPLGIIALILVLDFTIVLRSQIVSLVQTASKAGQLKKDIAKAKKDIAGGGLLKHSDKIKSDIFTEEKKIVPEQEIPLFLSEISQIAKDSNVKLMQIKPAKLGKEEAKDIEGRMYFRLSIDLDLISAYHPLGVFINKMETAERYVKVVNFNITSVKEAPFEYPVKMVIEILVARQQ